MQTLEVKIKASIVKINAWTWFTRHFPNADRAQFVAQVKVDEKNNISMEIFVKDTPTSLQSVFGSERKYWSQ